MRKSKPLELTYEKDDIDYKIYIFQGRAGKYEFKTIKAVTVALRVIPDEYNIRWNSEYDIWYEGASICSNQDQFSVNTGIVKAVGRADSGYCLDAYGQDDGDEYEYDESYLDIATSYATETAKRIDKRNIEKRGRKALANFHVYASECAEGIRRISSFDGSRSKSMNEQIEITNRLARA